MRLTAPEVLRVVLAVMVVGIHGYPFIEWHPAAAWYLYNGLFRIAVPSFFVLAGAFAPRDSAGLKGYAKRIILLYIVWSVLYLPLHTGDLLGFLANPWPLVQSLLVGYWHLWYLVSLALAALLLSLIPFRENLRISISLAVGLYLVGGLLQYFSIFEIGSPIDYALYRNALFFGLPLFLAGYHISTVMSLSERRHIIILVISAFMLCVEFALCAPHAQYPTDPNLVDGIDIYFSLLPVSLLMIALLLRRSIAKTNLPLGKLSVAIFLLHPGLLRIMAKLGVDMPTANFAFAVVRSFVLAAILVAMSRRVKFLL